MRILAGILLALLSFLGSTVPPAGTGTAPSARLDGWQWPVEPALVIEAYRAPAHRYGPGHRGIDIAAPQGSRIAAPAAGVVAFAGDVAGRPLVTIDHGAGLVTTLEPVAPTVPVGARLRPGGTVGTSAAGRAVGAMGRRRRRSEGVCASRWLPASTWRSRSEMEA